MTTSDGPELAAGAFSAWLEGMQGALRGDRASDVPCGGCTACCTASQFIHIGPDEADTLAHIPRALLFPAPGRPRGHVLLGYDERGHCPMLIDDRCSIYEHRPRTCRTYDCRIFPATGLGLGLGLGEHAGEDAGDAPGRIAQQARRWRFDVSAEDDRTRHDGVRAAAAFLSEHRELLPTDVPTNATQLAVLAIEIHEVFLGRDDANGRATVVVPDRQAVLDAVLARTRADGPGGRSDRVTTDRPPRRGSRRA